MTGYGYQSNYKVARRWTVIASGLLVLALALVVIYTGPNAFFCPVALVVVSRSDWPRCSSRIGFDGISRFILRSG